MNYSKCIHSNKEWLRQRYVNDHLTLRQIGKLCGCDARAVHRYLAIHKIKPHPEGFQKGLGEKSCNWKGGSTSSYGYSIVLVGRYHSKDGRLRPRYGFLHRIIAEKTLGRKLKRTEVIHHINHTRADNRPENLFLFKTQAAHKSYEAVFTAGLAIPLKSNLSMNG